MKYKLYKTFLILFGLLIPILGAETYLRLYGKDRFDLSHQLQIRKINKSTLRIALEPNSHKKFDFVHQGQLIYHQEVETDEWGRRKTYTKSDSPDLYLFFGCSYTFGTGLSQKQTLPYLFSIKSNRDSLNYAVPGFSPSGMMRQIDELPFEHQISKNYQTVNAFYLFYGFQWRRAMGSLSWIAKKGGGGPFYELDRDNKSLIDRGSFDDGRPYSSYLFYLLGHLHLVNYLPDYVPVLDSNYEKLFFCAIMNNSYVKLNDKLNGRLQKLNIIFPHFDEDNKWFAFLENAKSCLDKKVEITDIRIKGTKVGWMIDPVLEDHPSEKYNEMLSQKIIDLLNKESR